MPNELTELQKDVLTRLRNRNCLFLASATEDHWKRGEGYYIDDRVNVPARLRAKFEHHGGKARNLKDGRIVTFLAYSTAFLREVEEA
jgi:hypothetical protein